MSETEAYQMFMKENPTTFDVTTLGGKPELGIYLGNRLWKAFMAGANAGAVIERKRVKDRISKVLKENEKLAVIDALRKLGIDADALFWRIRHALERGMIKEARAHLDFVDKLLK